MASRFGWLTRPPLPPRLQAAFTIPDKHDPVTKLSAGEGPTFFASSSSAFSLFQVEEDSGAIAQLFHAVYDRASPPIRTSFFLPKLNATGLFVRGCGEIGEGREREKRRGGAANAEATVPHCPPPPNQAVSRYTSFDLFDVRRPTQIRCPALMLTPPTPLPVETLQRCSGDNVITHAFCTHPYKLMTFTDVSSAVGPL